MHGMISHPGGPRRATVGTLNGSITVVESYHGVCGRSHVDSTLAKVGVVEVTHNDHCPVWIGHFHIVYLSSEVPSYRGCSISLRGDVHRNQYNKGELTRRVVRSAVDGQMFQY